MDKERKMLYTILGALAALAAAAAVVLALKKRRCAEKQLIDEIDDLVSLEPDEGDKPCGDDKCGGEGETKECAEEPDEKVREED